MGGSRPGRRPAGADRPTWAQRLASLVRPLEPATPAAAVPPPLPPGRLVALPGRGEAFVRERPGPPGAPVLLLLHGLGVTADATWFRCYDSLAGYRLVAPDQRGHGRGPRGDAPLGVDALIDDAAALVEALGVAPVVPVGFSMGGAVAVALAARHPELVRAVVVAAAPPDPIRVPGGAATRWSVALASAALALGTGRTTAQRSVRRVADGHPELAQHAAWLSAEVKRSAPHDLFHLVGEAGARGVAELAPSVGAPAAVVVVTGDAVVPAEAQRRLAAALRAEVVEVAGDHLLPLTGPEAFSRAVGEALRRVGVPPTPTSGGPGAPPPPAGRSTG